jgi:hypothetical protein
LTHVLQSNSGLVCKSKSKFSQIFITISVEITIPLPLTVLFKWSSLESYLTAIRSEKECISDYNNYVSQFKTFINLSNNFNESKVFQVVDLFLRQIHQYYIAEKTDQVWENFAFNCLTIIFNHIFFVHFDLFKILFVLFKLYSSLTYFNENSVSVLN